MSNVIAGKNAGFLLQCLVSLIAMQFTMFVLADQPRESRPNQPTRPTTKKPSTPPPMFENASRNNSTSERPLLPMAPVTYDDPLVREVQELLEENQRLREKLAPLSPTTGPVDVQIAFERLAAKQRERDAVKFASNSIAQRVANALAERDKIIKQKESQIIHLMAKTDSPAKTEESAASTQKRPAAFPGYTAPPVFKDSPVTKRQPGYTGLAVTDFVNAFAGSINGVSESTNAIGQPHRTYVLKQPKGLMLLAGPSTDLLDVSVSVLAPAGDVLGTEEALSFLVSGCIAASPGWKDPMAWIGPASMQVIDDLKAKKIVTVDQNPHINVGDLRFALIGIPTTDGLLLNLSISSKTGR